MITVEPGCFVVVVFNVFLFIFVFFVSAGKRLLLSGAGSWLFLRKYLLVIQLEFSLVSVRLVSFQPIQKLFKR